MRAWRAWRLPGRWPDGGRRSTVARWTRRRVVPAYAAIPDMTCNMGTENFIRYIRLSDICEFYWNILSHPLCRWYTCLFYFQRHRPMTCGVWMMKDSCVYGRSGCTNRVGASRRNAVTHVPEPRLTSAMATGNSSKRSKFWEEERPILEKEDRLYGGRLILRKTSINFMRGRPPNIRKDEHPILRRKTTQLWKGRLSTSEWKTAHSSSETWIRW